MSGSDSSSSVGLNHYAAASPVRDSDGDEPLSSDGGSDHGSSSSDASFSDDGDPDYRPSAHPPNSSDELEEDGSVRAERLARREFGWMLPAGFDEVEEEERTSTPREDGTGAVGVDRHAAPATAPASHSRQDAAGSGLPAAGSVLTADDPGSASNAPVMLHIEDIDVDDPRRPATPLPPAVSSPGPPECRRHRDTALATAVDHHGHSDFDGWVIEWGGALGGGIDALDGLRRFLGSDQILVTAQVGTVGMSLFRRREWDPCREAAVGGCSGGVSLNKYLVTVVRNGDGSQFRRWSWLPAAGDDPEDGDGAGLSVPSDLSEDEYHLWVAREGAGLAERDLDALEQDEDAAVNANLIAMTSRLTDGQLGVSERVDGLVRRKPRAFTAWEPRNERPFSLAKFVSAAARCGVPLGVPVRTYHIGNQVSPEAAHFLRPAFAYGAHVVSMDFALEIPHGPSIVVYRDRVMAPLPRRGRPPGAWPLRKENFHHTFDGVHSTWSHRPTPRTRAVRGVGGRKWEEARAAQRHGQGSTSSLFLVWKWSRGVPPLWSEVGLVFGAHVAGAKRYLGDLHHMAMAKLPCLPDKLTNKVVNDALGVAASTLAYFEEELPRRIVARTLRSRLELRLQSVDRVSLGVDEALSLGLGCHLLNDGQDDYDNALRFAHWLAVATTVHHHAIFQVFQVEFIPLQLPLLLTVPSAILIHLRELWVSRGSDIRRFTVAELVHLHAAFSRLHLHLFNWTAVDAERVATAHAWTTSVVAVERKAAERRDEEAVDGADPGWRSLSREDVLSGLVQGRLFNQACCRRLLSMLGQKHFKLNLAGLRSKLATVLCHLCSSDAGLVELLHRLQAEESCVAEGVLDAIRQAGVVR